MLTKKYIQIDDQGFYVTDVIVSTPETIDEAKLLGLPVDDEQGTFSVPSVPIGVIEQEPSQSKAFYRPKWNGSAWVEGLSKAEIKAANPVVADWDKLQATLRKTSEFGKAMTTTNTNAWSLLLFALGTSRNVDDLSFAVEGVRTGLAEDFTADEIKTLNKTLKDCGVSLVLE